MATRGPPVRVQRGFQFRRFKSVLASAIFEWLLIFLLLLDALLSYLITQFANLCELQTPCLLCSRLDRILGDKGPGFYNDLICVAHKLEISSLAYCHLHKKLVHLHGMCQGCLFSCATRKKSLVGNSEFRGEEEDDHPVKNPLLREEPSRGPSVMQQCSCCNKPFKGSSSSSKSSSSSLYNHKSIGDEVGQLDLPLSHLMGDSGLNHQDGSFKKKRRAKPSGGSPLVSYLGGNRGFDPLSHIGYTEVKVTSDSESEVRFSDDDDGRVIVRETDDIKEDLLSQCVKPNSLIVHPDVLPLKNLSDDLVEKLIHQAPMPETSLLVPHELLHASEHHDVSSAASSIVIGHGLEELNWHQVEERGNSSALSADRVGDDPAQVSSENKSNVVEISDNNKHAPVAECEEVVKPDSELELASTELALKAIRIVNDPGHSTIPSYMDLNDAYKLAVSNKGSQTSGGTLTELLIGKDSTKVHEDLKLLISQVSAARGFEISWTEVSPRVHGHGDDFKIPDPSSSFGLQMLHKRLSIERNESGFESLDGSIVSDIEGESALDRLKRQFEMDRKSMSALYKELEEERSASAIAANQAMAMITRLQEEKAAMQMEALQYQRMMEEQAEYDHEALEKTNELLAQREKEIQDLEAEVEDYRRKFENESMEEKFQGQMSDLNGGEMRDDFYHLHSDVDLHEKNTADSPRTNRCQGNKMSDQTDNVRGDYKWNKTGMIENPLLHFEDEKLYISECLKKLEKKLHLFSNNGYVDMSGIDIYKDVVPYEDSHYHNQGQDQTPSEDLDTGNGGYSGEEALDLKDSSLLGRGVLPDKARCIPSIGDTKFITGENHNKNLSSANSDHDGQHSSLTHRDTDLNLIAIGNEVSQLNERLEILEADQNFLEHVINSLKSGNEGLNFIQEIASHLHELRRIGLSREQAVA